MCAVLVQCTDAGVQTVAQHCPRLEVLDVSNSRNGALGDVGLQAVAESCSQLRVLDCGGTAVTAEVRPRKS